jgi:hypothetical protein
VGDSNKIFGIIKNKDNSNNNIICEKKGKIDNLSNDKKNQKEEKYKIAKKYSLFNLKNDNKYTIINDGTYNSNHKENNKLSINNVYLNGKSENSNNKYIKRYNPNYEYNNLITFNNNYFKTYKSKNIEQYDKVYNIHSKFDLDIYRKKFNRSNDGLATPEKKNIKKFNKLFLIHCNEIVIDNKQSNKKDIINDYKLFK